MRDVSLRSVEGPHHVSVQVVATRGSSAWPAVDADIRRWSATELDPNLTPSQCGLSWSIATLSAECWSFLPPDSHEGEWQGAGLYLDGKRTAALRVSPGTLEGELARDPVTELGAAEGGAADHVCV